MTPERAAYHALMLSVGFRDAFEQEFDEALEVEDPISDLILALTSVTTDINATIAKLRHFCREQPPDLEQVYDLVSKDLIGRFRSGILDDLGLVNMAWTLAELAEESWGADWWSFRQLSYDYETFLDGFIQHSDYLRARERFLAQLPLSPDLPPDPQKKPLLRRILEFFHQKNPQTLDNRYPNVVSLQSQEVRGFVALGALLKADVILINRF